MSDVSYFQAARDLAAPVVAKPSLIGGEHLRLLAAQVYATLAVAEQLERIAGLVADSASFEAPER